MALPGVSFDRELNQVLFEEDACVKKVVLNRPEKLNSLTYQMVSEMLKNLKAYENDSAVKLVILKGKGKAFCAGGDTIRFINSIIAGHWSNGASFYRKLLQLDYLIATYDKPVVSLINGIIMGGGAGLSMNTSFRIVTEKAVFAMPEASIGFFPDVGASHFLSKLPNYFGEYIGLTGAKLNGIEMVQCGLATHFVLSKDLHLLEYALTQMTSTDTSKIAEVMDKFIHKTHLKQDSAFRRSEIMNKCFSRVTVEAILSSLENEVKLGAEKWMIEAVNYMKRVCPTSLKIFLQSIREGRMQNLEWCLMRDYTILCHVVRRTFSNDVYEGARAMLFEKDNKPKWEPSKLELVTQNRVNGYFTKVDDDDDWEILHLPHRSHSINMLKPKL